VDGPAKSPVENSAKHPMIYRVSTIQGGAGFRNHPQYIYIACDVSEVCKWDVIFLKKKYAGKMLK